MGSHLLFFGSAALILHLAIEEIQPLGFAHEWRLSIAVV